MRLNLNLLISWLLFSSAAAASLFDFGLRLGDQLLDFSAGWNGVTVQVPNVYLARAEDDIFISTKGMISFQEVPFDDAVTLDKLNRSAIAVFYAPATAGHTFYRATTTDSRLLSRVSDVIHHEFADSAEFVALQVVLVTWDGIRSSDIDGDSTFQLALATDGMSTYALMIYDRLSWSASGGVFAQSGFTHYDGRYQGTVNSGSEEINQLSQLSNVGQDGVFLFRVSGASIEDPRDRDDYAYYDDDESKENSKNCPPNPHSGGVCPPGCQSLVDDVGCSLCLCGEGRQLEVVAPPEERNFGETEEVDEGGKEGEKNEHGTTIAPLGEQGQCGDDVCNAQALCSARCCVCSAGYYGNGVECLKKDDPQRISGGFHGFINGQEIEKTELHTFVTTNDGKAYTAVSKIPSRLGHSFLLLSPIGSVMGYLFAETTSSAGARNGFQMMGGLFNRTATLHVDDSYSVTIQQTFSGRDIYHYFKAIVAVNGNLPELSADARVMYPDYEAEYRRESAGLVRAISTLHVTVSDRGIDKRMRMLIEDVIHFRECVHAEGDSYPSTTYIRVEKTHVTFDSIDGVVRYASENSASLFGGSAPIRQHGETQFQPEQPVPAPTHPNTDPCADGAHLCTLPHMICQAAEHKYRCECQRGFQAKEDSASPLRWQCIDLDECDRGDHNCDAYATCTNTIGSFTCECRQGFNGDGHRCFNGAESLAAVAPPPAVPELPMPALAAGHCTSHASCHQWGECIIHAGAQVGLCQCRGWYVGDGMSHCGPPEEQHLEAADEREEDEEGRRRHTSLNAAIPLHAGRPCGGYICDSNAECLPSPDGGSECVCRSGYHGNGVSCESLSIAYGVDEEEPAQGAIGTVCRSHEECSEHGSCLFSDRLGYYHCECTPPYRGDGLHCAAPDSTATEQDRPLGCDAVNDCSLDADCVYEKLPSEGHHFRCVCRSGFFGDGWRCTKVDLTGGSLPLPPVLKDGCDKERNCHSEAQCLYDTHDERYACECRPGFTGDGLHCVRTATAEEETARESADGRKQCREAADCHASGHCVNGDQSREYFCECLPGYKGDGVTQCVVADQCNPADPSACRQNAECVYGEHERGYVCKCMQGFTGDGFSCIVHSRPLDCSQNPRLCHSNAQCVLNQEKKEYSCICRPGSVGDGFSECRVQERPRCGNCSSHAHCVASSSGGWHCACNVGYQGNGHVCAPFTSCLDDESICDAHAECVPGEGGHYICNCHYGYHGNGRICTADTQRGGDELLVARGMAILQRTVQADVPGKQLIVIPHHIAVGIDFDCIEERIVWSDISGHVIRSASLNGSALKTAYADQLESPEGIAIDWSSRNIYYADSGKDEIGVLSVDGKYKKALLTEGLVNPRALAIDLSNKHLYYSDWHRSHPLIGRMDLDGKNVDQFVNTDIHLPNGLTILHERRELCWVDAGSHSLSCIGLDGRNRRLVFSDLQYPFGLTHINEQKFYWTDWKDNRVHTVSVYGEAYESFPISLGGSGKAYGILQVPKQCHGPATACSMNNGGCKFLCLPAREGVHCACPDTKKGSKKDGC